MRVLLSPNDPTLHERNKRRDRYHVTCSRRPTKPAGVWLAQDKRRPWRTDRARVSLAGWVDLREGWGARHPALIQRRGGPSGSLQEGHRGQEIARLARKAPPKRG
jgi:hypothetical protein